MALKVIAGGTPLGERGGDPSAINEVVVACGDENVEGGRGGVVGCELPFRGSTQPARLASSSMADEEEGEEEGIRGAPLGRGLGKEP